MSGSSDADGGFQSDGGVTTPSADTSSAPAAPGSDSSSQAAPTSSPASSTGADAQADSGVAPKPIPNFREVIERALGDDQQPASPARPDASNPVDRGTEAGQPAQAGQPGADADGDLLADPPAEEMQRWQPRTQKRFQALSRKVKELAPQAEAYTKIDSYLREAQLAPTEVVQLFEAGRLLKAGDFDGFMELVGPHLDKARQFRGEAFPADVKERLDNGYIDEASARELTRARLMQDQADQLRQNVAQDRDHQARQQVATSVGNAIVNWETEIRRRDPAYGSKVSLMEDRLRVLMAAEGVPRSPEAAVAMSRKAYTHVTTQLAQMRGPGRPTSPNPSSNGTTVNGVTSRPRNAREAMLAAMD